MSIGGRTKCPRCGAMARIADVVVNNEGQQFTVGRAFAALTQPEITWADLNGARDVLNNVGAEKASGPEVAAKLEAVSPTLAPVAELLRGATGADLAKLVRVLRRIIGVLVPALTLYAAVRSAEAGERQAKDADIQAEAAVAALLPPDERDRILSRLLAEMGDSADATPAFKRARRAERRAQVKEHQRRRIQEGSAAPGKGARLPRSQRRPK